MQIKRGFNLSNIRENSSVSQANLSRLLSRIMVGVGVLLLVSGCSRSVDPNFYSLTPKMTPLLSSNVKLIQVMPVTLPERLNTSLMVLQKSDGKTYVLDNQRWSSSLNNELQSGLSAGLQQKLGAIDVYNTGLTGGKVSYLIAPEFSRFDIVEDVQRNQTNIEVISAWVVKRKAPTPSTLSYSNIQIDNQQLNCRMSFSSLVDGKSQNFVNIVAAYQDSLNRVVDAIAISTIALEAKKMPKIKGVICSS